jgi:flavodoxin I
MNTLIIYATYSGGTETAVNILSEALKTSGAKVDLKNPIQTDSDEMTKYDQIILASPSWDTDGKEGQPHEDFFPFMKKNSGKIKDGTKFAIMGLGDSSYPHFCGAVTELEHFVSDNKGILTTASLKIDGFFFNQDKYTKDILDWSKKLT